MTYEDALLDRLVYGTPETVVRRLREISDELDLSGIIVEPNVGGLIPANLLKNSIRLIGQEVAPQLAD